MLKVTATAKGASFPAAPALPLRARLFVDGATGPCGETAFAPGGCVSQTAKGKITCK